MRVWLVAVGLGAALLAVGARHAQACSCVRPPPPLDALAQATAVFEARVARIETDATALQTTAHLIVLRQWKGDLPEDVTVTTASAGSLCGFPFQADQRVLLYADGDPGSLSVSMCSRSRPVELAGEDLAALLDLPVSGPSGTPSAPAPGPSPAPAGNPPPPAHQAPHGRPAPRTGGCGGCGGASVGAIGVVLAAVPRRRRSS